MTPADLADTTDAVTDLFERDECSNGDVLIVMAFLLLNMIDDAIRDGHPPLEALDECLTDIRNCVTDQFAVPRLPIH